MVDLTQERIEQYRADPSEFIGDLALPGTGLFAMRRRWAPFQQERFRAIAPSLVAVSRGEVPPKPRHWWECTKGGSKTSDIGALILWLLLFGRKGTLIQVLAADQDQAAEAKKAIKDLLRVNPHWQSLIEVLAHSVRYGRNDNECEILTTDTLGSHGGRPHVVIWDELVHFPEGKFAAAENLADNLDKVSGGLGIVSTNAGWRDTPAWTWREIAETSPQWSFHTHTQVAPWISAARIEEAKRRNSPQRFDRLWRGIWASGQGDLLPEDWLTRAITLEGPAAHAEPYTLCVAGLDLSTKRDHSAIAILAKHVGGWQEIPAEPVYRPRTLEIMEDLDLIDSAPPEGERVQIPATGKTRLVASRVWEPQGVELDFAAIEQEILALHCRFPFVLFADTWQASYMLQRLRAAGVECVGVDATAANLTGMFHSLWTCFQDGTIELYQDERLLHDLRSATVLERGSKNTRVLFPRTAATGHGDLGTRFLLGLLGLSRAQPAFDVRDRQLVLSPT